ncbi:MAG: hypothetical protein IJF87_08495 [Erysipelotrichaceae bacterium]|nr:hypothetical protein [Erysipelotrichaceae bacterium]
MNKCKLLSEPIKKDSQETETDYKDKIYPVYQEIFYNTGVYFMGKRVFPIKTPMHGKYEDSFYHMTTRKWERYSSYEHRELDYARTSKIHWIIDLLNNYPCNDTCCEGALVWKERRRTHIFLQIESYLIVLEDRNGYYTIVTAHVIFKAEEKRNLIKRYNSYK